MASPVQTQNVFKKLWIKNCLDQGINIKEMRELYRKELEKFDKLTKKEISIKVNSFYKFYWLHFEKKNQELI